MAERSRSKEAEVTIDHREIQEWVEQRGGWPATVKSTVREGEKAGLMRIDFPGFSGAEKLERISWEDFFDKFEKEELAFLYEAEGESRFSKFIARPAEVP